MCIDFTFKFEMKFNTFLLFIVFGNAASNTNYKIVWTEGVVGCEDVVKNVINVEGLKVVRKGSDDITLTGSINFIEDIPYGIKMITRHMRKRNNKWEYVFRTRFRNACQEIQRNDSLFSPFNRQMNISKCPIPKKVYKIDRIDVPTMAIASKIFLASMVGEYKTRIEISTKDNQLIACINAYNALKIIE